MALGWLRRSIRRELETTFQILRSSIFDEEMRRRLDSVLLLSWERKAAASPNPLLACGAKYFSQNDEDGILLEILRRCGIRDGTFLEIGVGDGRENNTLILLMHGWKGAWIGGQDLAFATEQSQRLRFLKNWITADNAPALAGDVLAGLNKTGQEVDVISLDIDSFDLHVMSALLAAGFRPKVLIVEYNAKFPPPVEFSVKPGESWDGSDYTGCSLQSWCNLLSPLAYRLVACNVTGVNAFFVRDDLSSFFSDVPEPIVELFVPCDYNWFVRAGHRVSPKTIASFL